MKEHKSPLPTSGGSSVSEQTMGAKDLPVPTLSAAPTDQRLATIPGIFFEKNNVLN
ncbi:hypothetical protein BOTU111922_10610 [Bordetella tumulicola]